MLQFLRRDQRRLRLPRVAVDSQPNDLQMAPIFHIYYNLEKSLNFSNQTTTFLAKNTDLSVPTRLPQRFYRIPPAAPSSLRATSRRFCTGRLSFLEDSRLGMENSPFSTREI